MHRKMAPSLFVLLGLFVAVHCATTTVVPQRLMPGDTVMFLSPSSPPCQVAYSFSCPDGFMGAREEEGLAGRAGGGRRSIIHPPPPEAAVEKGMAQYGLKVKWGPHSWTVDEYLAGTDEQRAADLMSAFLDPTVKAIIANRGGNGAARMLHLLNFTAIAANPKIVQGYSDVTVVLNSVYQQAGFVTFHGVMGLDDWTANGPAWANLVMSPTTPVLRAQPNNGLPQPYTIRGGKARGKLIGGNLSLVTNILGSLYAPLKAFVGNILFIEDVDEPPYKIDRYLAQLSMFGVLDVVSGVVFGQCTNCVDKSTNETFTIPQVLQHYLQPLGVPVFAYAQFGHISVQFPVPLGVKAEMDADACTIQLLEPAVY